VPVSPALAKTLALLLDSDQPLPPRTLYLFSSLAADDLAALRAAWPRVDATRRCNLVEDLDEIAEANIEVDFESVFLLGLGDPSAPVRAAAIKSLWESEAPGLMARFIGFMEHDPAEEVRAAAAMALGRYVYLGELEEMPAPEARRVEAALLAVIGSQETLEVRRRALEAIAYSSQPVVGSLIDAAYASPDERMRVSAVFAMGRSADQERWTQPVLADLESVSPEIRFEAVRAAGELELEDAVPALTRMTQDGDLQVREAAIWSLGQVGGQAARKALRRSLREAPSDERDFIRDALDNLEFSDEIHALPMFDFEDPDAAGDEPG
jgi:HEAT repeat protein